MCKREEGERDFVGRGKGIANLTLKEAVERWRTAYSLKTGGVIISCLTFRMRFVGSVAYGSWERTTERWKGLRGRRLSSGVE